jgi:hypothetical protein
MLSSVRFWFLVNSLALAWLLGIHFGTNLSFKSSWWWPDAFAIAANLLTGGIISFLFYFLVVFLPEKRKKFIIKTNLQKFYRNIKRDILWQVVFASIRGGRADLTTNVQEVDRLMDIEHFRLAFENGREADEGFYAFENQMSEDNHEFREIILSLRVLSKQIEFVLHNYAINDQKSFDFFKRLEAFLMRLQSADPGYDESKSLCQFIWEIFTGFNLIEGYRGYDPIEKMIKDI